MILLLIVCSYVRILLDDVSLRHQKKNRKQFVSICKELMVCWKHKDTTNKDTTNINHGNLNCRKAFGLKVGWSMQILTTSVPWV